VEGEDGLNKRQRLEDSANAAESSAGPRRPQLALPFQLAAKQAADLAVAATSTPAAAVAKASPAATQPSESAALPATAAAATEQQPRADPPAELEAPALVSVAPRAEAPPPKAAVGLRPARLRRPTPPGKGRGKGLRLRAAAPAAQPQFVAGDAPEEPRQPGSGTGPPGPAPESPPAAAVVVGEACAKCGKKVPSTSSDNGDPDDCKCPRCMCLQLVGDTDVEVLECMHAA